MSEKVQILMDKDELQPLANKIKILKGNNNSITLYGMENAVANANNEIESQSILLDQAIAALAGKSAGSGAPVLQEKTITPTTSSQNITPDSGYDGLSKVTVNAMPTATQATPAISVDSAGKITASAAQSAGYVSAGTKTATQQLTTQAAKTVTPSKSSQTAVASGRYTTGAITVAAIPSSYITTTDATATANDIVSSKTAYVNGSKITGTNPYEKSSTDTEVNTQATKLNQLKSILQGKAAGGSGGSSGGSLGTCQMHFSGVFEEATAYYHSIDSNGNIILKVVPAETHYFVSSIDCYDILCGSYIFFVGGIGFYDSLSNKGTSEFILSDSTYEIIKAPTVPGEIVGG